MDDDTTLDEIISLFVDINQQGVKVARFDIVKAICRNDSLLKQVFGFVAVSEKRKEDIYYKSKKTPYTFVLKKLSQVSRTKEPNEQVDRMWERLLEIVVFLKTKSHKKPVDILNNLINSGISNKYQKLNKIEQKKLRLVFDFLGNTYTEKLQPESKLITDATHFYSIVTVLLNSDLIEKNAKNVKDKIQKLAFLIDNPKNHNNKTAYDFRKKLSEYLDLSVKHTTDPIKRSRREEILRELLA
jgi:hypothetical protein